VCAMPQYSCSGREHPFFRLPERLRRRVVRIGELCLLVCVCLLVCGVRSTQYGVMGRERIGYSVLFLVCCLLSGG
jgi:hypothetical protein